LLRFAASFRVFKGIYQVTYSNFIQKHLAQSRIELYYVVQAAANRSSVAFILSRVKATDQNQQGIYLCKLKTYFLSLGSDVLDWFAAIHLHYFIFSRIFQDFQKRMDQIHWQVPLVYLLIYLSCSVKEQLP